MPSKAADCQKFRKEFSQMRICYNSARLQGFSWKNEYASKLSFDENTYRILEMRYKDLTRRLSGYPGGITGTGYDLPTILSEMAMDKIDYDYLDSHFKITVNIIVSGSSEDEKQEAISNFKKELASLSGVHQYYANIIIDDVYNGTLHVDSSKTLIEYIYEYMSADSTDRITEMATAFGLDLDEFKTIVETSSNEKELNEHNRFNILLSKADSSKAHDYFKSKYNVELTGLKLKAQINKELKEFILGKSGE